MWVFYLLFLFSYEILVDAEEAVDCEARPFDNCPIPQKYGFPGSEEEVNAVCPELIRHIDCLHNLEVECPERMPVFSEEQQYNKVRGVFVEICDNKTFLHRVVIENIACIKIAIQTTDACEARRVQLRKAYHKHKKSTYGTAEYDFGEEEMDDLRLYQCLIHAHFLSCATETINEKCGREAKSVAVEVFHRGTTLQDLCKPEVMPGLSDFLDVIKATPEEKSSMEAFVETYQSWPGIQVMLE